MHHDPEIAMHVLFSVEGFRPGPDTDILGGENRGGPNSRRHFSEVGQRWAGLLRFAAVWAGLQGTVPLQGVR
ncbi:hypothetical protein V5E97_26860 [Singulisphaera sp. Ch08]|uniref:Uncharacterized protein n=1 Tax=Singulisphaera sp. Ch08 TaxID=3120278 RepID=A0AAU7C9Z8_9BACT